MFAQRWHGHDRNAATVRHQNRIDLSHRAEPAGGGVDRCRRTIDFLDTDQRPANASYRIGQVRQGALPVNII